jgi:hypothetical protein
MNARIRIVTRISVCPLVVSPAKENGLQAGKWERFQKTLGRIRLLSGSPIASLRWAIAKRRAETKKKQKNGSNWLRRHCNNFAQYEQDGIVMGF